ncbi:MAG: fluoride efflux transporter CrcB [bacterium]
MQSAMLWVFIGLGGAVGAMLRYGVGIMAIRLLGHGFPYATLIVNITGSFLMGVFISWLAIRTQTSETLRLFFATGLLGAFTTFSTFSLDFVTLLERKQLLAASGYMTASVAVSIIGLLIGLSLGRALA